MTSIVQHQEKIDIEDAMIMFNRYSRDIARTIPVPINWIAFISKIAVLDRNKLDDFTCGRLISEIFNMITLELNNSPRINGDVINIMFDTVSYLISHINRNGTNSIIVAIWNQIGPKFTTLFNNVIANCIVNKRADILNKIVGRTYFIQSLTF